MGGYDMIENLYCHFSYRRPRGEDYILCATAFYKDFEGKQLVCSFTRAFDMWENQQYVCAIQSFEHALFCIWENQAEIMKYGVKSVFLVTDNSALAKWIENPKKNKTYIPYMLKAWENYRRGQSKEIMINVGLCETRKLEKSHKFCKVELIRNKLPQASINTASHTYKLDIEHKAKTIQEIIEKDTLVIPEQYTTLDT